MELIQFPKIYFIIQRNPLISCFSARRGFCWKLRALDNDVNDDPPSDWISIHVIHALNCKSRDLLRNVLPDCQPLLSVLHSLAAAWMDDYGWWQEVFCRWGMNPNFSDVFVTSQWSLPHQIVVNMNNINNNIRKTKTQKKSRVGVCVDGGGRRKWHLFTCCCSSNWEITKRTSVAEPLLTSTTLGKGFRCALLLCRWWWWLWWIIKVNR